jgi:nucleotide-binding universal stress UspA family protein
MYKKVLLATDGSEYANKAAEHAVWIANSSNAELIVFHVLETSKLPKIENISTENAIRDLLTEEAKIVFNKVSNILKICDCHVNVTYIRESGNPADIIIKTVEKEGIDIVVMGTAGKHGMSRFMLGSVAEKVVRFAQCPVLVVK